MHCFWFCTMLVISRGEKHFVFVVFDGEVITLMDFCDQESAVIRSYETIIYLSTVVCLLFQFHVVFMYCLLDVGYHDV